MFFTLFELKISIIACNPPSKKLWWRQFVVWAEHISFKVFSRWIRHQFSISRDFLHICARLSASSGAIKWAACSLYGCLEILSLDIPIFSVPSDTDSRTSQPLMWKLWPVMLIDLFFSATPHQEHQSPENNAKFQSLTEHHQFLVHRKFHHVKPSHLHFRNCLNFKSVHFPRKR